VPFIKRKDITFERGSAAPATQDADRAPHADPGESVFEVLRRFAIARGLLFYSLPDGKIVFGKPRPQGNPTFRIVHRVEGLDNNVLESDVIEDHSVRFSKIVVIGQSEDGDDEDFNVLA